MLSLFNLSFNPISTKSTNNPCSRCGLERVVSKTWTETLKTLQGESIITHTLTICPNPSCQAKVDAALKEDRARLEMLQIQKQEQEKERKAKQNASTDKR